MSALGSLSGTLAFVGDGVDDMSLVFRIFNSKDRNNLNLELSKIPAIPTTLLAGKPENF